jgi:hypothetical protein
MTHKVIIGDGGHTREENLELKKVIYGNSHRWFLGDTEFDGHHTLWGFEYFPTTYLKSSELSGDEYRKGGEIRYYKNRKLCYTEFCREPHLALLKIGATLLKLQDFPWEYVVIGKKVFYDSTPCTIHRIIEDQGFIILKTDDGKPFPVPVWDEDGECKDSIKVEIISPNIWWHRN